MTTSHSIRRRFVRDFGLPIQIVQDPHFQYFLNLYDPHFQTHQKFIWLEEVLTALGSDEALFLENNRIRDAMIETIQAVPVYEVFCNDSLEAYKVKQAFKQENIYTSSNAGGYFLSLDLKRANFEAMKHYDPALVLEKESYEELIASFTDYAYFGKSKYLRQVLFGKLMPKKQQRIQKCLVANLIQEMKARFTDEQFMTASSDEVVIRVPEDTIREDVEWVVAHLPFSFVRVEAFTLRAIEDKKLFVKAFIDSEKLEFKAIPGHYFAQCYKKYLGLPPEPTDFLFSFEGKLAAFQESLF